MLASSNMEIESKREARRYEATKLRSFCTLPHIALGHAVRSFVRWSVGLCAPRSMYLLWCYGWRRFVASLMSTFSCETLRQRCRHHRLLKHSFIEMYGPVEWLAGSQLCCSFGRLVACTGPLAPPADSDEGGMAFHSVVWWRRR